MENWVCTRAADLGLPERGALGSGGSGGRLVPAVGSWSVALAWVQIVLEVVGKRAAVTWVQIVLEVVGKRSAVIDN